MSAGTLTIGRPSGHGPPQGLRLTVVMGPDAGASVVIGNEPAIIGRAEGAHLRLTDPAVSWFHVELRANPIGVEVKDLESHNGTYCAGVSLLRGMVGSGATLEIGSSAIRIDHDQKAVVIDEGLARFGGLRGNSPSMHALFALLAGLAATDLSVLIEGPTGTGKELAAQALHESSPRVKGPFMVLDCTAIPSTLAESVLFGHERGAFTGASERRAGVFEAGDNGTIFLDEVGELPLQLQPKLLRVLEKREVVRVGGNQARPINVRIVCATWRDLRAMVNQGKFREDLYFRLAQSRVVIPALKDRPEDITTLVYHFLQGLPANVPAARMIVREALDELKRREYRGNVRELRSTVERAALLASGETITLADLTFERLLSTERERNIQEVAVSAGRELIGDDGQIAAFKEAKRTLVDEFERDYLSALLQRTGDNLSKASAISGVERHHLRDLLRKHGLRDK